MPRIPYEPYSTAQPDPAGERVNVNPSPAAFGENVGAAIEHLGATGEQVGNELFQRAIALQELQNQTDARNAQTDFATKSSILHAKFNSLEGKAASDALPQFLKDQADLRTSIRNGLGSPMARQYYDADSLPFMQRNVFSASAHAGEALKTGVIGTAQSSVDIAAKTFINPQDETEYDHKIQTVTDAANTIAGAKNWSDEQKQDYILTQTSKLRAAQITQVAHTDPVNAITILDRHKEDMTQQDYDLTMDRVRAANRAVGGVNLANSVYDSTKTLAQMEELIKEKSPGLAHGDPLFEKDAITALRGKYNQEKYATAQDTHATTQAIWQDGIMQPGVTNIQQLRAIPGMAEKIDSLPPDVQKNIPSWINSYQAATTKKANEANFTRLMGMSYNDHEGFLNETARIDTINNLSQPQIRKLMAVRAALIKNPQDDPRVGRAMQWMRQTHSSELQALGIYRRDPNNPDSFDHYTGALESAIDVWNEEKGKPPSFKEITDEIGPQVIKQRAGEHFWSSNRPFFDQTVPQGWGDDLKRDAEQRGEAPPTDEEIYRAYVRTQFINLYKKAEPKETPGG